MTQKPPLKPLSPQEWEILIEDFQYGGFRREKWSSQYRVSSILDQALSSILRKDFPLKLQVIVFAEEFADTLFSGTKTADGEQLLDCLVDALRAVVQAPIDNVHITFALKEQMMVSATSIFVSIHALEHFHVRYFENLVELLVTVINRPNHGLDRHIRAVACECLRELERSYPCLLSDVAGHLWSLCQSERTHASQSYILLLTMVIHGIVAQKLGVSILNTSVPLIPFNVPQLVLGSSSNSISSSSKEVSGLNYKELRRAMSFLLEFPHVLTPCGTMEFMTMIMPLAMNLELQASMLKVQFFGMIYSYDPILCHVVLMLYSRMVDAFDGQEQELARRLMLISREAQHYLVFRLLALHWLLGLNGLILNRDVKKMRTIVQSGLTFSPTVFDPLALKTLKLDLIAFCSLCLETSNLESVSGKSVVKLFEDGLVSVSAFKWLPPWSTETAVAFRTFHKFLIGSSSHSDTNSSATRVLVESTIFRTLKVMLVDLTLEFQRLVPVIVSFIDRLLACEKHRGLGEHLLQTLDEHLLPKVITDYKMVSYFPVFNRIAENDKVPPRRLVELLTKFMVFLVKGHGPDTGLRSWSQGSKVLGICRAMLMHHHGSRLFIRLSRLLGFTCFYFPDLEVRDNARICLRMLICIPGKKLREILNLGEQLLGVSPSPHSSSFFNMQSPRPSQNFRKPKNISSYILLQRMIPLLVKQTWSLSLSNFGIDSDKGGHVEDIRDSDSVVDERESNANPDMQIIAESKRISQPPEPLRVMDSKIAEVLGTLRRHFSCIPDFRHMPGLKVRIYCSLKLESEPFCRVLGIDFPANGFDGVDVLPALYATVLKFSSSALYGSIKAYHIPFLLGEPPTNDYLYTGSMDIVSVENGSNSGLVSGEDADSSNGASVTIELEPREPMPGLVDVFIETNAENGEIIHGQLENILVGIEDMFLKPIVPYDIPEDSLPGYYLNLYNALWEACGACSNTGRETFPLKGGKGVAAISGTRSVKLLEFPAHTVIQSIERYLAPFVVGVIGDSLISIIKDGGIIDNIVWSDMAPDSPQDVSASTTDFNPGPLQIKYTGEEDDDKDDDDSRASLVSVSKRKMGCIMILVFLPPRFHLLFQMEVCNVSTLVRIRTDHWPCLAYVDDYLEALFLE